jgi:hypothetical protein
MSPRPALLPVLLLALVARARGTASLAAPVPIPPTSLSAGAQMLTADL